MFGLIILENDSLVIVKYLQPNDPFLYAKNIYQKCGYQYFLVLLIYTYTSLFRQMLYRR